MLNSANLPTSVTQLATRVQAAGGDTWVVGGAVIASLLARPTTDFDLEIHGLDQTTLEGIIHALAPTAPERMVGKQFGVYAWTADGHTIEVSLPRRDHPTGTGHTDFRIAIDPFLGLSAAAERRDFTIDAIYQHALTGKIEDPTGGQSDLKKKILRVVDSHRFGEDPLRVLRGVQLVGRYELTVDPTTAACLQATVPTTHHLPAERFAPEWKKLFLRSPRPSTGLTLAKDIGYFRYWLPALDTLEQITQHPLHHPEGNVWTHTLQVVDHVKRVAPDDLSVLLAALFHDVGKEATSLYPGHEQTTHHHETIGAGLAQSFLTKQGFDRRTIATVTALVREHMASHRLYRGRQRVHPGIIRQLARRLAPATIEQLVILADADSAGRVSAGGQTVPANSAPRWLLEQAISLGLERSAPLPIISGRELLAHGWKAGPELGQTVAVCEQLGDQGQTHDQLIAIIESAGSPAQAMTDLGRALTGPEQNT